MKVHELIAALQECNQMAEVVVKVGWQVSDYTWAEEHEDVTDIMPWPEPKQTAEKIELLL